MSNFKRMDWTAAALNRNKPLRPVAGTQQPTPRDKQPEKKEATTDSAAASMGSAGSFAAKNFRFNPNADAFTPTLKDGCTECEEGQDAVCTHQSESCCVCLLPQLKHAVQGMNHVSQQASVFAVLAENKDTLQENFVPFQVYISL